MKQKEKPSIDWLRYERIYAEQGITVLCGIDEAGRGPLAGPVYAGAVILPQGCVIDGVNDSKKLSEKKREQLYDVITQTALSWGVGFATEQEIDQYNILQATFLAMRRAVAKLTPVPQLALVDGNQGPPMKVPVRTIIKGDGCCESIAAASILAKVSRDRLMREIDYLYPEYGFAKHKGYGTAQHRQALLKYGPCPIHRRTFLKKILGASDA
ncbi:MAG: ribonuclease HII [Oscillospiraceae bacterium]|nr:ribonuclease HII [Oscillospiraceae bacterium]